MTKYQLYEQEKRKLQHTCTTSDEYEKKVKELIEKLKI